MKELDLSIFPKTTRETWIQVAQNQLKGANPTQKLAWETGDIEDLQPYYDTQDIAELKEQRIFFSGLDSHRWKLYETITVNNELEANKDALAALLGGCDGIIFDFQEKKSINEELLLKDIDPAICDISSLPRMMFRSKIHGMNDQNCVFIPQDINTPVDQLSEVLGILEKHQWIKRYAFSDFFLEIATIRALRYLLGGKTKSTVHIHTTIPFHDQTNHQWFLNTSASLASVLGGSHSIDMPTVIGDKRVTRNVAHLIREESGLANYHDQCGGSYFIERLTRSIINKISD